jgi:hypothetical protein
MKVPSYQRLLVLFGYFLAGVIFLGGLLDAISNSISIFTYTRALVCTVLILLMLILLEVLSRRGRIKWRDQTGNNLLIKGLGKRPILFSIGMIFLLWVPSFFNKKEGLPQFYGSLRADSQIMLNPKSGIYPVLEIGDSGANFIYTGQKDLPIFKFLERSFLTVRKDEDQIKVSIQIRSRQDGLVAELVHNEWKINPQAIFDRNYSKDALEVRDKNGDIVLQVKIKADKVQLQFKSYGSNEDAFAMIKDPSGDGGLMIKGRQEVEKAVINPLFKYPSDLHFGELR